MKEVINAERRPRFKKCEFSHGLKRARSVTCQATAILSSLMTVFLAANSWAENNTTNLIDNTVTNYSSLNIPASSPGVNNSLQILNGGVVGITNGDLTIGPNFGDNNNYVLVSGTNSLGDPSRLAVTGTTFTTIWVGSSGSGNQLIISNGGQVIGQATFGRIIIGYLAPSNSVIVTGPNSLLTLTNGNASTLNVGWSGSANQLIITNGGRVNNTGGTVGLAAGNNSVLVTDAGSVWSNSSTLSFGMGSAGNTLTISSGGRVDVGGDFNSYAGFANNKVLVTGSNSLMSMPNSDIFLSGDNARLTIADGGRVVDRSGYIGYTDNTNNVVIVTDPGSLWSNTASITMGHPAAAGTQLIVTNGGLVVSPTLVLGNSTAATSNTVVTVTGSNSTINLTGALTIGKDSASNTLQIVNGGRVKSGTANVGNTAGASNNFVLVSGPGSVWSNTGTLNLGQAAGGNAMVVTNGGRVDGTDMTIGGSGSDMPNNRLVVTGTGSVMSLSSTLAVGGHNASLTISDGARVSDTENYLGNGLSTATNIVAIVSGAGTQWTNSSHLSVGYVASGALLIITNGARVDSNNGYISRFSPASSNKVVVTGSNSLWNIRSTFYMGDGGGGYNQLLITDGGRVNNGTANIGSAPNASNNTVLVSGSGSVWSNTGSLFLGDDGGGNQLTITNGGRVDAADATIGGPGANTPNNSLLVTGNGSLLSLSTSLGMGGHNANLTISDGGRVVDSVAYVGNGSATATNVVAMVTGAGSLWSNSQVNVGYVASGVHLIVTNGGTLASGTVTVGLNGSSNGLLLVTAAGVVEANTLITSSVVGNSISNRGGIYQFTTVSPTITPNIANSIVITNGTISYRDVSGADIYNAEVAEMAFQGNNSFQLKNATNASVTAYKFDSIANTGTPTNYQRLVLAEGGSRWVGGNLTIGTGGAMLVSNSAAASVSALVTNLGSIEVKNSKVTFEGKVIISGSYVSDPSTNTYLADVTVSQSGSLAGGAGDLFDFKKSLFINSTNRFVFDLDHSAVQFSGGGMHTNAITGQDFGTNDVGFANNFAYGELHLGSAADQICFTCGILPPPAVTNIGLYVGWLDLLGNSSLYTNLHAANGINIYYDQTDTRNAYLGGLTYALTDCNFNPGGGSLIAFIPEPSALLLLSFAGLMLLPRKR